MRSRFLLWVLPLSAVLTACGTTAKVASYDKVTVYPKPDYTSAPVDTLSTYTEITIKCHVTAGNVGYYKVSYRNGDGYIGDDTEVMDDKGELKPSDISTC